MNKKYIYRGLVWSLLIIALIVITYNVYNIFIKNSVKQDIAREQAIAKQYDGTYGKTNLLIRRINQYNEKQYDDSKFEAMIPTGYDEQKIISDYVESPILTVGAEQLSLNLTDKMPSNISWSNTSASKNINGVDITITINIDKDKLEDFINELEASIRLIYFGNISYVVPTDNTQVIKVKMDYYVFYKDATS